MAETKFITESQIADNGEWRLIIDLGASGLKAWLRNTSTSDGETRPVCYVENKSESLLEFVESAVYDNPTVLGDFEADIIVTTPRYLFVPRELCEHDEDFAVKAYARVFGKASEEDLMADNLGDYICLYEAAGGLKSFISRTFPGARVASHIAALARHAAAIPAASGLLFTDVRDGRLDIVGMAAGQLRFASTRPVVSPDDAVYHVLNAMSMLPPSAGNPLITVGGETDLREAVAEKLKPCCAGVQEMADLAMKGMAPAPALCCIRQKTLFEKYK